MLLFLFVVCCLLFLSSSGGSRVGRRGCFLSSFWHPPGGYPACNARLGHTQKVLPDESSSSRDPPGSPGGSPAGLKALRGHFWRPPRRLSCMVCLRGAQEKSAPKPKRLNQPMRPTRARIGQAIHPPRPRGRDPKPPSLLSANAGSWVLHLNVGL